MRDMGKSRGLEEYEGEFFMVLKGHSRIELDDGNVERREGESFGLPKGIRHNPVADSECHKLQPL
jgi:uncharacterized cupin superfamily protein